jgi:hypothetical protein
LNTFRQRHLILAAALVFLIPAVRSEQPPKASRATQEDRIKKLEERVDATEQTATSAAMEKDYITRTQKQYESYYQKVLNTQMWTLGVMGLILIGVFVLVARFSLKMIEEQAKAATAGATVQMRNEYARTLAKEIQKLWDSNAADFKILKETLTAQIAELERNVRDRSDFQMHFVQALAAGTDERHADSIVIFRNALSTYKFGKPQKLIEAQFGAITARSIFESLEKTQPESFVEKAREELADPLYNGLEEELAIAALQTPWLTALINERRPALPEPPKPEPTAEAPATTSTREVPSTDPDLAFDEESDSCRLITT